MSTIRIKNWIEILLHLAFWSGVFYILTSLSRSHIRLSETHSIISDQHEEPISSYVYLILAFLAMFFYGNVFWVFKKMIQYKNIIVRLAICITWFSVVFGANYVFVGPLFKQTTVAKPSSSSSSPQNSPTFIIKDDHTISSPKPKILPNTGVVNFVISNWLQMQPVILLAFLVILGISFAYFFLKEWAKSELIQTKLQANQLSTEIKFLKSQINPHFLFNTLNNLFSMAQKKGNEELADGISKLSGMMRYMLYDSNAEYVSLATEITYLKECITLNKLRYADEEVIVWFNLPTGTDHISIAPMLFVPFVENAFKYGVAIGKTSTIEISIVVSEQKLTFACANANHSTIKKTDIKKSGIGLENVKRRLELLYPNKYQLHISETVEVYSVNLEINLT